MNYRHPHYKMFQSTSASRRKNRGDIEFILFGVGLLAFIALLCWLAHA